MALALVRNPIYQQLNHVLRELIRSDEYRQGDRFLSERDVSERFQVSRATANKALSNLVSEGVLRFKKGVGTFVQRGVLDYDLRALVSFTDKARAAGKRPSTEVREFRTIAAREVLHEIRDALRAGPDARLFYVERLRLADRTPVILERRHVVATHCPGLRKSDLRGSLYAAWTERIGLSISGATETIRAVNMSPSDAKVLRAPRGAAGLLVTSTGYLTGEMPLWFERTLYRGDAYEFRSRLGGLETPRPTVGALYDGGSRAAES